MANPTKTTRRWHRKTPLNARRTAIAMAIAASSIAPLVESRGHRISELSSIPLVISDKVKEVKKTAVAYETLKNFNLEEELVRVKESKTLRPTKGKMRNRRYIMRKGLLIIHDDPEGMKAFRNIVGVDLMNIDRLDIKGLAPGGTPGRLIMWTDSAFRKVEAMFGTFDADAELKKNFRLPNSMITTDDLDEVFYSAEVQAMLETPNFVKQEDHVRTEEDNERIRNMLSLYNKVSIEVNN